MERAILAKVGALVFAGALVLPTAIPTASAQAGSVMVASAVDAPVELASTLELPEVVAPVARSLSFAVADDQADPGTAVIAAPALAPVVAPPAPPPPEPLVTDGIVLASWYGPGFFGNRTACGQTYTPETIGVAHRTLPCGTLVAITSPAGVTVVAPVIDRGPFVAGRSLDLSSALKHALGCSDLCHVHMTVAR